ncbi:META domain-containing protein [Pseudidiomarina planktonica]|uniref:META domain-containing protein n=1 Tax=Pseudidiomarina planktonica TaxID=1323738 RepID=A0A1Y6G010_9GAMM|nr:copper resistance protein NlpE N-terminal domain-containing protein [Pseudidiomarina planktonica]RUO64037.1 hypothetical protein CWI77_10010 [Pseudidiomarina planktonica]SMQ79863.1 META domain-containing protein [Pseudidiomarina planktonica]
MYPYTLSRFILAVALLTALGACAGKPDGDNTSAPDMHNSRNALDWAGPYSGVLPCDDCAGIFTRLNLTPDNSYTLQSHYLGKTGTEFRSQGLFYWNDAGSHIILDNMNTEPAEYQVAEGSLLQVSATSKQQHALSKTMPAAQAKQLLTKPRYWQLKTLNGEAVEAEYKLAEPVVFGFTKHGIVSGFLGCNRFRSSYQLSDNNGIELALLATTKMACQTANPEQELADLVAQTDSYVLQANQLTLLSTVAGTLAVFEPVAVEESEGKEDE